MRRGYAVVSTCWRQGSRAGRRHRHRAGPRSGPHRDRPLAWPGRLRAAPSPTCISVPRATPWSPRGARWATPGSPSRRAKHGPPAPALTGPTRSARSRPGPTSSAWSTWTPSSSGLPPDLPRGQPDAPGRHPVRGGGRGDGHGDGHRHGSCRRDPGPGERCGQARPGRPRDRCRAARREPDHGRAGAYRFRDLPTGTFYVGFHREHASSPLAAEWWRNRTDGLGFAGATPLTVDGNIVTSVCATLDPGGVITGRLVDGEDGSAVAGCLVRARAADGSLAIRRAVTDSSGGFAIGGLSTARYLVQVDQRCSGAPTRCSDDAESPTRTSARVWDADQVPVTLGATSSLPADLVTGIPAIASTSGPRPSSAHPRSGTPSPPSAGPGCQPLRSQLRLSRWYAGTDRIAHDSSPSRASAPFRGCANPGSRWSPPHAGGRAQWVGPDQWVRLLLSLATGATQTPTGLPLGDLMALSLDGGCWCRYWMPTRDW